MYLPKCAFVCILIKLLCHYTSVPQRPTLPTSAPLTTTAAKKSSPRKCFTHPLRAWINPRCRHPTTHFRRQRRRISLTSHPNRRLRYTRWSVLANSRGMKRAVVVDKELYNLPDMRRADRVCELSRTLSHVGFHS